MMRLVLLPAVLCGAALHAADSAPRPVPIDNEYVKVIDASAEPHRKTRIHDHKVNRVMVYLNSGSQRIEWQDGRTEEIRWNAGQPLWSPAGGMHTAEITSDTPVRILEIELKKAPGGGEPGSAALDPVKLLPRNYKVEFENDHVRVVRVKAAPRETLKLHEHATNRVAVMLTEQNFRITAADGTVQTPKRQAGEVSWGTPVRHVEENLSDRPFEIIMVDLK
ncbi:MAG TPA: hypothetical protein VES20_07710 [Bryobacteraceae bacterium]|nr:hypothetical protein [Bryobacteraceae bacterium]